MKKNFASFIFIICIFLLCVNFISCDKNNNKNFDVDLNKNFNVDLTNYIANIDNATALGISNHFTNNTSNAVMYNKSHLNNSSNKESKNYMVMSTSNFVANDPEINNNEITKITFTKYTTENSTKEIRGSKYVTAKKNTISFSAVKDFKYSVLYNDNIIYNNIQDNDIHDLDNKSGVIELKNIQKGLKYKIEYNGIGSETTITQDDIDGEIDKLCVMNGYTFISFVPNNTSQRPIITNQLKKDINGYIEYDTTNYFSNNSRQSFVIDNRSGYIYPIKDITIQNLHNNLLLINNLVYDYKIINDNLTFYPLFTNTTISINNYMKDKYGNNYIFNDKISTYDETTQSTFIVNESHKNYILSPTNELVCTKTLFSLKKMSENRTLIDFNSNDYSSLINNAINFYSQDPYSGSYTTWQISHVENGYVYWNRIGTFSGKESLMAKYEIATSKYKTANIGSGSMNVDHYSLISTCIDYNNILFFTNSINGIGQLYTAKIWNDTTYGTSDIDLFGTTNPSPYNLDEWMKRYTSRDDDLAPTLLFHNCLLENNNLSNINDWRIYKPSLTGTDYYRIVIENNKIVLVNENNYIAPTPINYTLYPLNK